MKTIKIHFIDGGFRILHNVIEFSAAKQFLFVAQQNNGSKLKASAFIRKDIEDVYRKNHVGKYVQVKLAKSPYESKYNKDYVLYKMNQEKV